VQVRLPWEFPTETPITIAGKGGGFEKTIAFSMPPNPKKIEQTRSFAAMAVKNREQNLRQQEKFLQDNKKRLAQDEANLARAKGDDRRRMQSIVTGGRYQIAMQEQCQLPMDRLGLRRDEAKSNFDSRAILQTYLDEIPLRRKYIELQIKSIQEVGELSDRPLKNIQDEVRRLRSNGDGTLYSLHGFAADAAFRAGDADLAIQHHLETIGLALKKETVGQRFVAISLLRNLAEHVAMLTGDRNRAADYLLQSRALELQLAPPERHEQIRKGWQYANAPAWWPEGKALSPDVSPSGVDLKGLKPKSDKKRPRSGNPDDLD
jgi:hypothetical protein